MFFLRSTGSSEVVHYTGMRWWPCDMGDLPLALGVISLALGEGDHAQLAQNSSQGDLPLARTLRHSSFLVPRRGRRPW